ncbi:MAG: Crp/Fnr family transcriptional regulator [Rhodospirillaceae bacterium]|nr:Crp/Fnr family transcriptional regulator [Rhodospirillaceae bacterium]
MPTFDKKQLIATNYLFQDLDPAVLDQIVDLGVTRKLGDGEILFQKGDDGDALFGVLSGKVRIVTGSPGGKEVLLNIMEPGEVFGEIALLDGLPRTADAVAMGVTELMVIRRGQFTDLLERQPRLAVHLLQLVCARLRWVSERIEDVAFLALPARLAKRLLGLADLYGEPSDLGTRIALPISQSELGQLMGTSRESINKHLQSWRRQGWIELERRHVTIRDADRLREVVDGNLEA